MKTAHTNTHKTANRQKIWNLLADGAYLVKNFALDLIFPKLCVSCGQEGAYLCSSCRETTQLFAPSCPVCKARSPSGKVCRACRPKTELSRFFAPFSYKNPCIRELLHIYKYGRAKELSVPFAEFMETHMGFAGFAPRKNMAIIPIPLHWLKKRERGFNQAQLIAERLGAAFGLPVLTKTLVRIKQTKPQINLENDALRMKNVDGAFFVADPERVSKKTIVLVDDVSTSGATINEAARVLREAGARSVWAAVVARR